MDAEAGLAENEGTVEDGTGAAADAAFAPAEPSGRCCMFGREVRGKAAVWKRRLDDANDGPDDAAEEDEAEVEAEESELVLPLLLPLLPPSSCFTTTPLMI